MKYFLDADVVLDVVLFRREFGDSIELVSKFEKYGDQMMTSPLVLAIVFYLVEKNRNRSDAKKSVKKMRRMMEIVPLNQGIVDRALLKGLMILKMRLNILLQKRVMLTTSSQEILLTFLSRGKSKY